MRESIKEKCKKREYGKRKNEKERERGRNADPTYNLTASLMKLKKIMTLLDLF